MAWIPLAMAKGVDLYQIDLPAASQADAVRIQLMRQGLAQVLAQVSGNERIEKNKTVKAKLNKADHFVQEYRYEQTDDADVDTKYVIHIRYNQSAVLTLLKKIGAIKQSSLAITTQTLLISPITTSNDLRLLIMQLTKMSNVKKVELTQITGDAVSLLISVRGSSDAFQQQVENNQQLAQKNLTYEWLR